MTTETQIENIQQLIHYAPEKKKEYLRQIQQQEYLQNNKTSDIN